MPRYEKRSDRTADEISEVSIPLNMDNLLAERDALEEKLVLVSRRITELVTVGVPMEAPKPVEPE